MKIGSEHFIGRSAEIREILSTLPTIARSDSTVLITGESGTGKELIARALHTLSSRARAPFIPLNCGAIPSELLESELFGHVKGAFTGAIANRKGRFEMAEGGTLFLDEIGDMPAALQVKLLRVLQAKSFEAVGSGKTIETDIRVVAATNVNLESAVAQQSFRSDLFYRLNVIPIHLSPLRERREDIAPLVEHFLKQFVLNKNYKITNIDEQAMDTLVNYAWPGNVRELQNLIERICVLKQEGVITREDIPKKIIGNASGLDQETPGAGATVAPYFQLPDEGLDFKNTISKFEEHLMVQALNRTGWNKNKASDLLRMNRTTLVEKLKKKGIGRSV